jgi:hypothetical protein
MKVRLAGLLVLAVAVFAAFDVAAQQAPSARTPKAAAPFDPSGYWVPLITEEWRFRMITTRKSE